MCPQKMYTWTNLVVSDPGGFDYLILYDIIKTNDKVIVSVIDQSWVVSVQSGSSGCLIKRPCWLTGPLPMLMLIRYKIELNL